MFWIFKKSKKKLFFRTDVHSHLVPGVDDGSGSVSESISLMGSLNDMGVDHFIITPHVTARRFENDATTIAEPLAKLRSAVAESGMCVEIDQSAEYRIDDFYEEKVLKPRNFMPMPNNHILLESNWQQEPLNLDGIVYNTSTCGYQVIFAHPERYRYLNERYERYEHLHNRNLMFQVNLLSFSGFYGKTVKDTAFWLLERGMVDFVGTDIHNHKFLRAIEAFLKSKDYKRVLKLLDRSDIKNDTAFL